MTSKKFRLNGLDVAKGALVSTLTSGLMAMQVMLSSGTINWELVGMAAAAGFVAYLTKNFFSAPAAQTTPPPSPN